MFSSIEELTTMTAPRAEAREVLQILVADHRDGPATLLADLLARLLPGRVRLTQAPTRATAGRALRARAFDLVLVGLEEGGESAFPLLATLCVEQPHLAAIAVHQHVPARWITRARYSGAWEVVKLPNRMAALKPLVRRLVRTYLASG